ncbi:MAG: sigma 54-interacting transcriptional regulator [Bradymonadales bacterium]|nr:sigma 54-interacting transcriptional regulator [Bradymonadales bacterium]
MTDFTNQEDSLGIRTVFVRDQPALRELKRATLVVVEGPDVGAQVEICKAKTYLGRSRVCELTVNDPVVSGTHAVVEAIEGGFLLRDLNSTNGTYLGDVRVVEIYLHPRARFRIGSTIIEFRSHREVVAIPISPQDRFGEVVGRSLPMRELFATLEKVSPSDLTILIEGETGTGKERVARSIHQNSRRAKRPYVVLDCSSIPRDLMESVVFGHEKGAFTGAIATRKGAFEQADGGTIFLDEVGELDLALQPKLLRVLESRELKRVGGDRTIHIDVRVIAATNRDIRTMVAQNEFREDLFFRLSVIQVHIAPLRERKEDIVLLAEEILDSLTESCRFDEPLRLSADAIEELRRHDWPGNIRELKNVLTRAASLADSPVLKRQDLVLTGLQPPLESKRAPGLQVDTELDFKTSKQRLIDEFERRYLDQLMAQNQGNISAAAKTSGLTRYHLREMLKKHDLTDKFRK